MADDEKLKTIKLLVSKYQKDESFYRDASKYNENSCRLEFIDPFLELLGWDIRNKKAVTPTLREIKTENYTTENSDRPDYTITLRGIPKIFVEAKKPAIKIENDPQSSIQARRYGWNGKHPFAVLTNFEYLIIFDTRNAPSSNDLASVSRFRIYHYLEYVEKIDEIEKILSREAVYSEDYVPYINELFNIVGPQKSSVDSHFLSQVNMWRLALANDLISTGKYNDEKKLNDVVQSFINEIVFLRICEDKHLPTKAIMSSLIDDPADIQNKFEKLFQDSDKIYNSGIFRKGSIIFDLSIETVKNIVNELYYPKSPYLFNIIDSTILGSMYESFLTEHIIIEKGQAKLAKKKDYVDRSVVSTPPEIVNYIVSSALSDICKDKPPQEILQMSFLDPACGSGIFLEQVYEHIIQYLLEWYSKHDISHLQDSEHGKVLPFEDKKLIASKCIFGIDIDVHAVEIAKFSLLIKMLDNETESTVSQYVPILPNLDNHIVVGNTLITREDLGSGDLSTDTLMQVLPFDPLSINNNVRFDAIVGNPPYTNTKSMINLLDEAEFAAYKRTYNSAFKQFDKYFLFIEKSLRLLKDSGQMCMIVPNKFMRNVSGCKLRSFITSNAYIVRIDDFGALQLFDEKSTYCMILKLSKSENITFYYTKQTSIGPLWAGEDGKVPVAYCNSDFSSDPWILTDDPYLSKIVQKIKDKAVKLGSVVSIFNGIQTSAERPPIYWFNIEDAVDSGKKYVLTRNGKEYSIEKGILKPYFKPVSTLEKGQTTYNKLTTNKVIIFPYDSKGELIPLQTMKDEYPGTLEYLSDHYERLVPKQISGSKTGRDVPMATADTWYRYGRSQALSSFVKPKLIVRVLNKGESMYAYDSNNFIIASGGTAGYCAIGDLDKPRYDLRYIQAWLNNPKTEQLITLMGSDFENGFTSRGTAVLKEVPFIALNLENENEKAIHDKVVNKAKKIQKINEKLSSNPDNTTKAALEREKEYTINEINKLIDSVYDMVCSDEVEEEQ